MSKIDIPDDWSPQQALAVSEFLIDLQQQIWEQYDRELFALLRPDLQPPEQDYGVEDDDFDDDIPL